MIASDISLVLRQGIWASLTGGWYHDPAQPLFNNTVHLYLWLFFFLTPLLLDICFGFAALRWWLVLLYAGLNLVVFAGIKFLNWRLHRIFDVHEVYSASPRVGGGAGSSRKKNGGRQGQAGSDGAGGGEPGDGDGDDDQYVEAVEMVEMTSSAGRGVVSSNPAAAASLVFGASSGNHRDSSGEGGGSSSSDSSSSSSSTSTDDDDNDVIDSTDDDAIDLEGGGGGGSNRRSKADRRQIGGKMKGKGKGKAKGGKKKGKVAVESLYLADVHQEPSSSASTGSAASYNLRNEHRYELIADDAPCSSSQAAARGSLGPPPPPIAVKVVEVPAGKGSHLPTAVSTDLGILEQINELDLGEDGQTITTIHDSLDLPDASGGAGGSFSVLDAAGGRNAESAVVRRRNEDDPLGRGAGGFSRKMSAPNFATFAGGQSTGGRRWGIFGTPGVPGAEQVPPHGRTRALAGSFSGHGSRGVPASGASRTSRWLQTSEESDICRIEADGYVIPPGEELSAVVGGAFKGLPPLGPTPAGSVSSSTGGVPAERGDRYHSRPSFPMHGESPRPMRSLRRQHHHPQYHYASSVGAGGGLSASASAGNQLSDDTLREIRHRSRKSYPGKSTSSVDLFLNHPTLGMQQDLRRRRRRSSTGDTADNLNQLGGQLFTPDDSSEIFLTRQGSTKTVPPGGMGGGGAGGGGSALLTNGSLPMSPVRSFVRYSSLELPPDNKFLIHKIPEREIEVDGHYEIIKDDDEGGSGASSSGRNYERAGPPGGHLKDGPSSNSDKEVQMRDKITKLSSLRKKLENLRFESYDSPTYEDPDVILEANGSLLYEDPDDLRPSIPASDQMSDPGSSVMDLDWLFRDEADHLRGAAAAGIGDMRRRRSSADAGLSSSSLDDEDGGSSIPETDATGQPIYSSIRKRSKSGTTSGAVAAGNRHSGARAGIRAPSLDIVTTPDLPEVSRRFGATTVGAMVHHHHQHRDPQGSTESSKSKNAAIAAVTAGLSAFSQSEEQDGNDTKELEKLVIEIINNRDRMRASEMIALLKDVMARFPDSSTDGGGDRQRSSDPPDLFSSSGSGSRSGGASASRRPASSTGAGRRSKSSRGLPPVPPYQLEIDEEDVLPSCSSSVPGPSGLVLAPDVGSTSARNSAYQPAFLDTLSSIMQPGTHMAEDHEDTSNGAIHIFEDENGKTWMYTFDADGVGTAQEVDRSDLFMPAEGAVGSKREGSSGGAAKAAATIEAATAARRRTTGAGDSDSNDSEDAGWIGSYRRTHMFNRNTAVTFDLPESAVDGPPASMLQARAASRGAAYRLDLASLPRSTQRSLSSASSSARSRYHTTGAGPSGAGTSTGFRYPLRLMMERTLSAAQTATNSSIDPMDLVEGITPSTQLSSNHYSSVMEPLPSVARGSRVRLLSALAGLTSPPRPPSDLDSMPPPPKRKQYYKIHIFPKRCFNRLFRLNLNRLQLMALLDRNTTVFSCIFDVLLAGLVSLLAGFLLQSSVYHNLFLIVFCAVVSGSLFCLVKSVQPDAASPIHGFNWMVSYNRPGYFILLASIVLALTFVQEGTLLGGQGAGSLIRDAVVAGSLQIYSATLTVGSALESILEFLSNFILALPIIFTLGLLPQLNTFFMHLAEQAELHLFGGTASVSFLSALFAVTRSLVSLAVLTPLAWLSLVGKGDPGGSSAGAKTSSISAGQNVLMSVYLAAVVTFSFWLSRSTSNIGLLWRLAEPCFSWMPYVGSRWGSGGGGSKSPKSSSTFYEDLHLLSGGSLTATVKTRIKADLLSGVVLAVLVFAVHSSTLFQAAQPHLTLSLAIALGVLGLLLHYLLPQMRKHNPWLLLASPLLKLSNYSERFTDTSQTMQAIAWFERVYAWLCFLERNVVYPVFILSAVTEYAPSVTGPESYFGPLFGCLILTWAAMKILRTAYACSSQLYQPLITALLLFRFDFSHHSMNLLLDFAALTVVFPKFHEMYLKLQFIFVYLAPWQISWGSTFHAFAQPFTVPHSALLFAQAFLSSILSSPLNPFLGSVLFLMSYMRPVKFWEKDYNTRRVDNSNTRLITQIDRGPTSDDNNLNSIFYEHLTRSLQTSLAGDVMLGRMATTVAPGDCFILASEYLNCLLHIVELGNGFVTFQLRGLEFRGTYCQQREVEAIQEDVTEMNGCCCCEPGRLSHCLSFNTAFKLRWFSWEVTHIKYALQGYSITDNSASSLLQVYELRQLLVSKYVKCILYYAIRSPKLEDWLCCGEDSTLGATFDPVKADARYVDLDAIFSPQMDEDYDAKLGGISRASFAGQYAAWIAYCVRRREDGGTIDTGPGSTLMALCYLLTLVGRRTLVAVAHNRHNSVDSFLYGLHALFKGDYRITSTKDEWIFADMDFLRCVIAPAVRMSLKLHDPYSRHNSVDSFLYGLHALFKGDYRITSTKDEWIFADMDFLRCVIAPAVRMSLKLHDPYSRHNSVDSFLYGLHALFKGDYRITSTKDEWIFADMDFLRCVIAPAVRMSLKLHDPYSRHNSVDSFLYGLHALFKGDYRITSTKDEWIFADMDFLRCVIAPAVRMSLKLHDPYSRHNSVDSFLYGLHALFKGDYRITSTKDEWIFADMDFLRCVIAPAVRMSLKLHDPYSRHNSVDSFLYGLHALFKGDYRITSTKDEWIFADMDFLRCVIAPAVRMSLKLHQDHFAQEEYNDEQSLYEAISRYEASLFISHEGDPEWRTAVLSDVPSLLALRHVYDGSDGSDEYKVIMLNRKTLFFSLIKLNRECVRGLWAGQQQELIFLRNRNTERGSIQNARQVLRNMINSSADQPIGYPIYVSPLITSFSETNVQLNQVLGPSITLQTLWSWAKRFGNHIRSHCGMTCSSNVSVPPGALAPGVHGSVTGSTAGVGGLPPGTAATLPPNVGGGAPGGSGGSSGNSRGSGVHGFNNTLPLTSTAYGPPLRGPPLRQVNAYSRPVSRHPPQLPPITAAAGLDIAAIQRHHLSARPRGSADSEPIGSTAHHRNRNVSYSSTGSGSVALGRGDRDRGDGGPHYARVVRGSTASADAATAAVAVLADTDTSPYALVRNFRGVPSPAGTVRNRSLDGTHPVLGLGHRSGVSWTDGSGAGRTGGRMRVTLPRGLLNRSYTHPPRAAAGEGEGGDDTGGSVTGRRPVRVITTTSRRGPRIFGGSPAASSGVDHVAEEPGPCPPATEGSLTGTPQRVRIRDATAIFDRLNETVPGTNGTRRFLVQWPAERMCRRGGRSYWRTLSVPRIGTEGDIVHRWTPCNSDMARRSHIDKTILLLRVERTPDAASASSSQLDSSGNGNGGQAQVMYVPVAEQGVEFIGSEV